MIAGNRDPLHDGSARGLQSRPMVHVRLGMQVVGPSLFLISEARKARQGSERYAYDQPADPQAALSAEGP
jgi:hypothetical protein